MLFKSEYGDEFAAVQDHEVGKHWCQMFFFKDDFKNIFCLFFRKTSEFSQQWRAS